MSWSMGATMAPFVDFIHRWRAIEPKVLRRLNRLDMRPEEQGTVEDFLNLAKVVEQMLEDLARYVLPLPLHVRNATAFVHLWSEDDLGDEIALLEGAYVIGFRMVAEEQVEILKGSNT